MEEVEKQVLSQLRARLVKEVHITESFLRAFCDSNILDDQMTKILKTETNDQQRVSKLLDLLPSRGARAFTTLMEVLETTNPWLTEKMKAALHEERNRDAKINLHPAVAQNAAIEGYNHGRLHIDPDIKERATKYVRTNLNHLTEVEQRGVDKWLADELQRERRRQQFRARHTVPRQPGEFHSSKETQTDTTNIDLLELYEEMTIYLHGVDFADLKTEFSFKELQQQVTDLLSRTRKLDAMFLNCVNKFEDSDKYTVSLPDLIERAIGCERDKEQSKLDEQKLIDERDTAKRQVKRLEEELERLIQKQQQLQQQHHEQQLRHRQRYSIYAPPEPTHQPKKQPPPEQPQQQQQEIAARPRRRSHSEDAAAKHGHQSTERGIITHSSGQHPHAQGSGQVVRRSNNTTNIVYEEKPEPLNRFVQEQQQHSQTQRQENAAQPAQPINAGTFAAKIRRHASEESLKIAMSKEEAETTSMARLTMDGSSPQFAMKTSDTLHHAPNQHHHHNQHPQPQRNSRLDLQKKMQTMLVSPSSGKQNQRVRRSESEKAAATHGKSNYSRAQDAAKMFRGKPSLQSSYEDIVGVQHNNYLNGKSNSDFGYMTADGVVVTPSRARNGQPTQHMQQQNPSSKQLQQHQQHQSTQAGHHPRSQQHSHYYYQQQQQQSHNMNHQREHQPRSYSGQRHNSASHKHQQSYATSGYLQRYANGQNSTTSTVYANHVGSSGEFSAASTDHPVGQDAACTQHTSSTPEYMSDSEIARPNTSSSSDRSRGRVRFASPVFRTTNPHKKGHGGRRMAHYMDSTSATQKKVRK